MANVTEQIVELSIEIEKLKVSLSSEYQNPSGLVVAIINLLDEIHNYLSDEKLTRVDLNGFSFGVFRLVTDDYELEKSPVGQRLLNISAKIRDLGRRL